MKRNHEGGAAPIVGGKLIVGKSDKKQTVKNGKVALTEGIEGQSLERRTSKRSIKAYRQINFVYQDDVRNKVGQIAGVNNNVQVDRCLKTGILALLFLDHFSLGLAWGSVLEHASIWSTSSSPW